MRIEISHINKQFDGYKAIDDLSLNIEDGKIFGLLGPNGAGKTTLIRMLNQITMPDSGTISFDGKTISRSCTDRIGYLPEERGLYKKMKIGEQAVYLAQLKGLTKKDAETRLKQWFRKFEIESWWNKKVEELSKGMQQKVQFIVTVVHEPQLLIFDEPFSGFDPINAELLKNEIIELNRKGTTTILSTHNMASVEELCDDIVLINHGKNILNGSVHDIKQRFKENIFETIVKSDSETTPDADFFDIISQETNKFGETAMVIKKNDNVTVNEMIAGIMRKGEITSFKEKLPSMNEIFIREIK